MTDETKPKKEKGFGAEADDYAEKTKANAPKPKTATPPKPAAATVSAD